MGARKSAKRPTPKAKPPSPEPPPPPPPPPAEPPSPGDGGFPIVGIGASAGGLEALEAFMRNVTVPSGMAYVVVQHLDPTREGMLVELLQRHSPMPVVQATDGVRVEPDHVYVIPPSKDMSLLHGALHLMPQIAPRGLNLPIDLFFRSLAADQGDRSIGVILSGMGSDGTLGLRAIKEKAGACFVQAITSAKFDGMPRSAIEAGLADVVAPADELPARIVAYRHHSPRLTHGALALDHQSPGLLDKVYVLLRAQTGNDFSQYKQTTIHRRIERRMSLHQIDSIGHYVRFLRENPREIELLFKELLIGVTSFFRDPAAWDQLKHEVLPALLRSRPTGSVLRAWVAGCSTGEEAYSLAMVFKEAMEPLRPVKNLTLQIFATDLDRDAIEKARQGFYPDNIAVDVSPERLRRFFVQEERGYRVGKEIREMVVFAPQNIIMDPPFTKLDVLSCRNLLIYLSSELQKKVITLFRYALNPGGILFLGSAETIGATPGLFAPLDAKNRLYRRTDASPQTAAVEFPASALPVDGGGKSEPDAELARPSAPANLQTLADRVIVQRFSPVGVLCTDKGDILYISGRAGKYLEPAVGKANLNIMAMARDGLRYDLTRAFGAAVRHDRPVTVNGVRVDGSSDRHTVDVTIQRLREPKELAGTVMVVLADAPAPAGKPAPRPRVRVDAKPRRVAELEHELERSREEVQTTREEMQTSQEELKSTNEELQSTNEELQSSNEELTTSKEEMQSLNEELQTVNQELSAKVDELSRSNNDMKNLLNSTEIATLFLDGNLNVRRFTTTTTKLFKLLPGDAGRQITDITSDLDYDGLVDDAREVLGTLVFKERKVVTRDGRWFVVRIMPYRTLENLIDGVVITFSDASASRALDTALAAQAGETRQMLDALPALVWIALPDGTWDQLGRQWVEYTGVPEREQLAWGWLDQLHPEDRERVRSEWRAAVKAGTRFETELRVRHHGGDHRWFHARAIAIRDARGMVSKWFGTGIDVDELKRTRGGPGPEGGQPR